MIFWIIYRVFLEKSLGVEAVPTEDFHEKYLAFEWIVGWILFGSSFLKSFENIQREIFEGTIGEIFLILCANIA